MSYRGVVKGGLASMALTAVLLWGACWAVTGSPSLSQPVPTWFTVAAPLTGMALGFAGSILGGLRW